MLNNQTTCIRDLTEWKILRRSLDPSARIGFVPTMGNLHKGHASLLQRARAENDYCILSLFINKTQFNNDNDFEKYPKTTLQDIELATSLGIDYVLIPSHTDLYKDDYTYQINCTDEYAKQLEGEMRPGHFTGMLTVVLKLLQLTKPTHLYLGEKDYQQLTLIKGMIDAFFLDTTIVPCDIVREDTQLAYSSRNQRLSAEQRQLADTFAQIIQEDISIHEMKEQLHKLPIEIDYISQYDNRLYAAITIDGIRLIDNKPL